MDDRPTTRYAKTTDGVAVAYQVFGQGPLDLVFLPDVGVPLDLLWDEPAFARLARRLGAFSQTLWCEARGMGASGGDFGDLYVGEAFDGYVDGLLGSLGSERAVLVGPGHAGPMALKYAAAHSERVTALVLINTFAYYSREDDYPWGMSVEVQERFLATVRDVWGTGLGLSVLGQSRADDEGFRTWWARCERLGLSPPNVAETLVAAFAQDVRSVLPALTVPTLVVHREGNPYIRIGAGRYLAECIPGATYAELPGVDHLFFVGDVDPLADEIEQFLTGGHQAPEGDVITTTVLFTDIVASTERSARVGHRRWTMLSDQHDVMVRAALKRHQGREVKTIGDGFLATFDATTRGVRAAIEIVMGARRMGLDVRAGVHTGEVGVRPNDVVGLPVSIAKRICDIAEPGEVLVSEVVKLHLVGSGIEFNDQGEKLLKGVPGRWRIFAVAR